MVAAHEVFTRATRNWVSTSLSCIANDGEVRFRELGEVLSARIKLILKAKYNVRNLMRDTKTTSFTKINVN